MTSEEQLRVNRVVQALTTQRNNALNEVANLAAALDERDAAIAALQAALAKAAAERLPLAIPEGVGGAPIESILEK